ncbi:MAG TPA: dienelactone hydrolase family protein [Methylomirabilota bacterium]|nr:dienelactone hydrolase family protein [Methylomirabilota bacterium]
MQIPAGHVTLEGELTVPPDAKGLVLFAHGSGSGRHSPRNQFVAGVLQNAGMATLLFDLLTKAEEDEDSSTGHLRFDIELLAGRLVHAARATREEPEVRHLNLGFFGASTGGGAAIVAAAQLGEKIRAVVSRGGRPDLAGSALGQVTAATLLIVGGEDPVVIQLNEQALRGLHCEKALRIVRGAGHLFEEPGTLDCVADLAAEWFSQHFGSERA